MSQLVLSLFPVESVLDRCPRHAKLSRYLSDSHAGIAQEIDGLNSYVCSLSRCASAISIIISSVAVSAHSRIVCWIIVFSREICPVIGSCRIARAADFAFVGCAAKFINSQMKRLVSGFIPFPKRIGLSSRWRSHDLWPGLNALRHMRQKESEQ